MLGATGELPCEIPVVISNHPDLEHVAVQFGIPFRCLPLDKANGGKPAQEAAIDQLLEEENVDTIVLARYMQVRLRWPALLIQLTLVPLALAPPDISSAVIWV